MDVSQPLVSNLILLAMLKGASAAGVDRQHLLRALDLEERAVSDPDGFVGAPVEAALWSLLADECRDPEFPFRAARALTRGQFRALEYAVRSSDDLGQGLGRLAHFSGLLYGRTVLELSGVGEVWLAYRTPHEAGSRANRLAEPTALACTLQLARSATGRDVSPSEVVLSFKPPDPEAYRRFFGVMPRTSLEAGIKFSAETTRLALPEADPVLCEVVEKCLRAAPRKPMETTCGKLERVLRTLLPTGRASLDDACAQLGMSRRTLQQRLQEEGSSFQDELNDLRMDLAKDYLDAGQMTVPGIALVLGYSEATSFYRAFKRATGVTPRQYRAEAGGAQSH